MVPLLGRRSCGRPAASRSRLDARAGLSHNPLLLLSVENAIDIRNAHRDHGEVLAAIVAGAPDAAEAAMRAHLRRTRDSIIAASTVHVSEPASRAREARSTGS